MYTVQYSRWRYAPTCKPPAHKEEETSPLSWYLFMFAAVRHISASSVLYNHGQWGQLNYLAYTNNNRLASLLLQHLPSQACLFCFKRDGWLIKQQSSSLFGQGSCVCGARSLPYLLRTVAGHETTYPNRTGHGARARSGRVHTNQMIGHLGSSVLGPVPGPLVWKHPKKTMWHNTITSTGQTVWILGTINIISVADLFLSSLLWILVTVGTSLNQHQATSQQGSGTLQFPPNRLWKYSN